VHNDDNIADTSPPLSRRTYDVELFRPDGGVPAGGVLVALLLPVVAALVVGLLISVINQWFYLILFFPLGMGFLVGLAGCLGVRLGRVRSAFVAGIIGLLAGILVMLASYFGDYLLIEQQMPGFQQAVSFREFMDLQAKEGVNIGRLGRGNDGVNLGYVGSYIYWLAEIFVAALVACAMTAASAGDPYCRFCHSWKNIQLLGALQVDSATATEILNQGEIYRFQNEALPPGNTIEFSAFPCDHCQDEGTVEIKATESVVDAKGQTSIKSLGIWRYPGESYDAWSRLFRIARRARRPD